METTTHVRKVIRLSFVSFVLLVASSGLSTAAKAEPLRAPLSGKLSYVEAALNSVGVELTESKLPAAIRDVKLGTAAYYAGLRKNDKIVRGALDQNILTVEIDRNGQRSVVKLPLSLKALRGLETTIAQKVVESRRVPVVARKADVKVVPKVAEAGQPQVPAEAKIEPEVQMAKVEQPVLAGDVQTSEILKKYHVILVVDHSGSMGSKDEACDGLTKLEWCQNAIMGFAQVPEVAKRKFTLVLFNNYVDVITDCDAPTVERMFQKTTPEGGTDLSEAIVSAIRSHRATAGNAPCILAVLHDGLPNRGQDVEKVLIDATKQLQSEQDMAITFLQIGKERGGSELLQRLDNNLVEHGAKFDIVDSMMFVDLKARGLKEAIVSVVKNHPAEESRP